jgi:hypothetical protein
MVDDVEITDHDLEAEEEEVGVATMATTHPHRMIQGHHGKLIASRAARHAQALRKRARHHGTLVFSLVQQLVQPLHTQQHEAVVVGQRNRHIIKRAAG